jgi:LmbE family N-acetylglucosaminyl deacetylase
MIDSTDETSSTPSAAVDAASAEAAAEAAEAPIPAGPKRIAAFMAHPDDAEFMCAGTLARWAAEGNEVILVLLTRGESGDDLDVMPSEQLIATREAEQRAANAILGLADVVFLGLPDGFLVNDLATREKLVRVMRRLKPDVVVCQDPTVRWEGQIYINHPDHRAAGDATLDALFPAAGNPRAYPQLRAEGLEPHKVREVYLAGAREPDVWIDVTDFMDIKLRALRAHVSQLGDWDPEEMLRTWAKEEAARQEGGGEYAESFKYFKLE